jgi:hypothetical protein
MYALNLKSHSKSFSYIREESKTQQNHPENEKTFSFPGFHFRIHKDWPNYQAHIFLLIQ